MQDKSNETLQYSQKELIALELGKSILEIASLKDLAQDLDKAIYMMCTHNDPSSVDTPIQELSSSLFLLKWALERA